MGTIRAAIELQDNFTSVLYQIVDSVNLGLSAMGELQQAMSSPVDSSSLDAARDSINQATIAAQELNSAMGGVPTPTPETPAAPTNSAPVVLPVQPDVPDPLVGQPAPVDLPVEPEQPEPVQVPVHWQSDNMEVFTSTGIERFEQEVQSANNMLNALGQAQSRIAARAAQTDLFPDNAIADMNNVQNRLQAVQQRIQAIENNPLNMGSDTANAELEQLRGQLDQALQEQEALNRAVEDMDVEAANQAYLRLSQTVGNTERYIRDNVDEQGRFNREIEEGANGANSLMRTIEGAVAAYATVQTLSAALDLSDQLASTTARLDLMNDELQTTQALQDMIFLSAERARGSYQATADAVSKLGLMAGDAFGSSEEIIAFTEQLNKQFTIAGTEAAGIEAAMLQLTQAMGSGVLRGEEYNSILEQAPNIIQAIADYMEVPKGKLKDMAAEGQITADIVKAAMFAAADEANAKFESMPVAFEQVATSFWNHALIASQPVLQRMNEIANSGAFQNLVNNAIEGLPMVAGIALEIFDLLAGVAGAVADNWSWLAPIIYGATAALVAYYTALGVYSAIQATSNGIKAAAAFAEQVHAASLAMETGATFAATAAQHGFNAALLACPITWTIIGIIALVALFYAAVAAVNKFAGTSVSATGIICGVFMVAAAFIGNLFVTLINFVIDIFVVLWNFMAAFANFFGNVFNDPVGAIARLFFDLVDTILSLLESLAGAIDTIFGSNLAGAVSGWRGSLSGWVDETFGQGEEIMAKVNAQDYHLDRFEYKGAWDAGYDFGEGVGESISNFGLSPPSGATDTLSPDDYASALTGGPGDSGIGGGVDDIAGNTGAIRDSMEITEEELKYMRDIAEQEAINRFTTAEIHIEQTNHNTIKSGMDLDGVVLGLTDAVNEAVDVMAEGVHV